MAHTLPPQTPASSLMSSIDQRLIKLLSKYPDLKLAILFGSQALGSANPSSDIDLGLLAEQPLSSRFVAELIAQIGAEFGKPVDIIDLYHVPEPVFKGKRLLGDNATYAQLLTRHLLNTADFVPLQQRILRERRGLWIK
jgi:predicted nucleotidyltransferase